MARLRRDLKDGSWKGAHRQLLTKPELDVGLRLVVVEVG
jgi:hypothetical protein